MKSHSVKGKQVLRAKSDLLHLLRSRELQLETLDSRYWTVIGNGSIGSKAEELKIKAWAIECAGFTLYPRVVFAMGFFENFMKRTGVIAALGNGEKSQKLQEKVMNCNFTLEEETTILNTVKGLAGTPLAVRSSAHGDSRGTGIYKSKFFTNDPERSNFKEQLFLIFKEVLASQFSEDAMEFRRKLNLPLGMAVIVEQVFGERIEQENIGQEKIIGYGPLYGGFAYTYTSRAAGVVSIAGGLPIQAVGGRHIDLFETDNFTLDYAISQIAAMTVSDRIFGINYTSKRYDYDLELLESGPVVLIEESSKEYRRQSNADEICPITIPDNQIKKKGLSWLFKKLRCLQALVGKPQYVEWAATVKDGVISVALTQIADVDINKDFYDFAAETRVITRASYVEGSGRVECDPVVYVSEVTAVKELTKFNKRHRGYALIISSFLLTSGERRIISFKDISNASVVIEEAGKLHGFSTKAHFGTSLKEAGIIFISANAPRAALMKPSGYSNGFIIYNHKVRVTASERQQKAIVEFIK